MDDFSTVLQTIGVGVAALVAYIDPLFSKFDEDYCPYKLFKPFSYLFIRGAYLIASLLMERKNWIFICLAGGLLAIFFALMTAKLKTDHTHRYKGKLIIGGSKLHANMQGTFENAKGAFRPDEFWTNVESIKALIRFTYSAAVSLSMLTTMLLVKLSL